MVVEVDGLAANACSKPTEDRRAGIDGLWGMQACQRGGVRVGGSTGGETGRSRGEGAYGCEVLGLDREQQRVQVVVGSDVRIGGPGHLGGREIEESEGVDGKVMEGGRKGGVWALCPLDFSHGGSRSCSAWALARTANGSTTWDRSERHVHLQERYFFSASMARNAFWSFLTVPPPISTSPPLLAPAVDPSPALANVVPGPPSDAAGRFLSAPNPILPLVDLGRGAGRKSVEGVKSVDDDVPAALEEPAVAFTGGGA